MGFDMSFDFSSLQFKDKRKNQRKEAEVVPKVSYEPAAYENAIKLAQEIDYKKDYCLFLAGTFIFGDFLEALCIEKDLCPNRMFVTTLGMNERNINSLASIVRDYGCCELNLIVSHYFAGVEKHGLIPYMTDAFKDLPIKIAVVQSHAKIVIIRSGKGNCAITGSANLSSSNNVEQATITHDKNTITFLESSLQKIMDQFTIYDGEVGEIDWTKNNGNVGIKAFHGMGF